MGKSIVHCAICGYAIHEADLAGGKASTIDHRTYCAVCLPAAPAPQASVVRRGSTARISVASGTRRSLAASPRKSILPPALGIGAGILVIAVAAFALFPGGGKPRAVEPEQAIARPASGPTHPDAKPFGEAKKDLIPLPAHPPAPVVTTESKETPSPATAEPAPTPKLTITYPSDRATFDAPAAITITVEAPGDIPLVEFFEGSTKIGECIRRPFTLAWKDVPPGEYRLTARATAESGEALASSPIAVRVVSVVAAIPEGKKPMPAPSPAPVPVDLGVDPKRVDEAIAKGAAYLKASAVKDSITLEGLPGLGECPELILWTLVHARVPENDPDFVKLFNYVLRKKLERTYSVALQAMILEEANRVKYQVRIAQCAQFLMDAQCANGQWSYSGPAQSGVPTTALKPDIASWGGAATFDAAGVRIKPKVIRKITTLRKMQEGPPMGDNSNSQYAALGLRACSDAGIVIPKAVIQRALTWWRISQHDEEGEKRAGVATGDGAEARAGWCYGPKDHGHPAYASMTAGAVGSVAIWNFLQDDKSWAKDPALKKGLAWLDRHFSVNTNEGPDEHAKDTRWMLYYYLYALERAGVLASTETFGQHKWYVEGAQVILAAQRGDGSWLGPLPHGDRSDAANAAWDTCFAILFLKRATRPLVASTDARLK